jgi:hypothetical protein
MSYESYLEHHGIKGMKWGVRRYRNPDGTLTEAGNRREAKLTAKADKKQKKLDRKTIYSAFNDVRMANFRVNRRANKVAKLRNKIENATNEKKIAKFTKKTDKILQKMQKDEATYDRAINSIKPIHTRQGKEFVMDNLGRAAFNSSFDEYSDGVYYVRQLNRNRLNTNMQLAYNVYRNSGGT